MAFRNILRFSINQIQQKCVNRTISIIPSRSASFKSSEIIVKLDQQPQVVVDHNPPEWKYVEDLLGYQTIPKPTPKSEYPSGWCPPDPSKNKNLPYFIARTKNFMVPAYLHTGFRGYRRTTQVKSIEGDIWKLEQDLRNLIVGRTKKPCYSRINEMNRTIVFKGDYVTLIQKYFYTLGL